MHRLFLVLADVILVVHGMIVLFNVAALPSNLAGPFPRLEVCA